MAKTVFITGASSGIGEATARLFVEKGWQVAATSKEWRGDRQSSANLLELEADVRDSGAMQKAIQAAVDRFGGIDVVVNNAGFGLLGPVESFTPEQIEEQFAVNVTGLINTTRLAIPHLRKSRGTIVNIASMMGRISFPFFSAYAASKWAVEGFSESLMLELEPHGVRVKVVEPGTIKTRFFEDAITTGLENPTYAQSWRDVLSYVKARGSTGASPDMAARVIYNAATDRSRKLRYRVDLISRLLPFARATLPLRLYHFFLGRVVR